ncbi:MAG: hypothetical protein U0R44_03165 [Candidatus Micrarchaeia archaeon]
MDALPILSLLSDLQFRGAGWVANWAPLSALALMVSLLLHIVFLLAARVLSIKEFENYAMSEILQALSTAVMVGSLLIMVNSAMDIAHSFITGDISCFGKSVHIGTTNQSTMDEAFDAIRCRLQEKAVAVAKIQGDVTTGIGTASEFNILNTQGSLLGLTVFKGDWIGSLYRATETARITNNLATTLLIGLNAQSSIIAYLKANMLNLFIPFGIFLRSIYFSRSVGALFIAFGIGMYFIFPIFFVLLDPGFVPAPPVTEQAQPPIQQPYCYATMSNTVSVLQTLQAGGLGTTGLLGNQNIRDELSKSYITLMLHPLVAFFLTMVFVRYIITVLGADSYEIMRMVSKVV